MRGRRPTGAIRRLIKHNQSEYSLTRDSESTDSIGETVTTETTHTAYVYLYQPTERPLQRLAGEDVNGALLGLCLPREDIQPDDRLMHGGDEYEVESVNGSPNNDSPVFYRLTLTRL